MTAFPCRFATCSIDVSTNGPNGEATWDARLADTGSIDCVDRDDPDLTDGLFVQIAGLTDDATSAILPADVPCGQSLTRDTLGNMFAIPEGAVVQRICDDPMLIRNFDGFGDYDTPEVFTPPHQEEYTVLIDNPFDCPAWCYYTIMEMGISGNRVGNAAEPFYFIGDGRLIVPNNRFSGAIHRVDVHGHWTAGPGNAPNHQHGWDMHALFPLTANEQNVPLTHRITINEKYHFDMSAAGSTEGGVRMIHAAAVFWRQDCYPKRGFHGVGLVGEDMIGPDVECPPLVFPDCPPALP